MPQDTHAVKSFINEHVDTRPLYYLHFVVKLLSVNIFSNRPSILSFLSLREIFWKKKQIKIKPKFPAVKCQQTSKKNDYYPICML